MRPVGIVYLVLCLALASGCRHCCWGKRASEKRCPTDIRKGHFWCFGEDAIFHAPCGPAPMTYGHQPTCWREWPMSGAEWRDTFCSPAVYPMPPHYLELPQPAPESPAASPGIEAINPFRSDTPMSTQPEQIEALPPGSDAPADPSDATQPNQSPNNGPTSIQQSEPSTLRLLGSTRAPPARDDSPKLSLVEGEFLSNPASKLYDARQSYYVEQIPKPADDQRLTIGLRRLPPI